MKTMVEVNLPALIEAIIAVAGEEQALLISEAYTVLDRYEDSVRNDAACDNFDEDYEEGFQDGFNDGYDAARQAFYADTQPDVIYLPDQTNDLDHNTLIAVAALEGGPSEL